MVTHITHTPLSQLEEYAAQYKQFAPEVKVFDKPDLGISITACVPNDLRDHSTLSYREVRDGGVLLYRGRRSHLNRIIESMQNHPERYVGALPPFRSLRNLSALSNQRTFVTPVTNRESAHIGDALKLAIHLFAGRTVDEKFFAYLDNGHVPHSKK